MKTVTDVTKRALIACSRLVDFAGAEITALEIAQTLQELGFEVTMAALEIGHPFQEEPAAFSIPVVDLTRVSLAEETYDLLWVSHHVAAYHLLGRDRISAKAAIFYSLSHFEPLEAPPVNALWFSQYLVNSDENLEYFRRLYPELETRALVQPNSAPSVFFLAFNASRVGKLARIAFVSNHIPSELMDAVDLLRAYSVDVDLIGVQGRQVRVDPEVLTVYDAVVTIGKTVQYALACGVPVFCYDRFGGPGWIATENFDSAAKKNFSGRCTPVIMSGEQLRDTILSGFNDAFGQRESLRSLAQIRFDLKANVVKAIERARDWPFEARLNATDRAALAAVSDSFVRLRQVVANSQQAVVDRDARVATLKKELEDREAALIRSQLDADRTIGLLDRASADLRKKEAAMADLSERAMHLEERIAALSRELAESRFRSSTSEAALNSQIESIYSSTSWRVTAPLRALSRGVGKARREALSGSRWMRIAARRSFEVLREEGVRSFVSKARAQTGQIRSRRVGAVEQFGASFRSRMSLRGRSRASGPMVSFVIPIYDRTDALRIAIKSALNQTYRNIEVLLVTDGSPAETIGVVNEFRRDRRVKIFNYPTSSGNAVRGRNKGIKEARGKYIAFLDSDDIATPDRLEKSLPLLESGEADVVYGAWRAMLDGTRAIEGLTDGQVLYSPDSDLELLKKVCVPCQSTVIARKDLLQRAGFLKPTMKYREDHELWARLAYFGGRFKAVQHPLVDLRLHAGNNELNFKDDDNHWEMLLLEEYTRAAPIPKKIVFLVAGVGISGGLIVILKYANFLMSLGHDVSLVNVGERVSMDWMGRNNVPVIHVTDDRTYLFENIDLLFATFWTTCVWMEKIPAARKLYFIQSDERLFYDDGASKAKVAETYLLPFELLAIAGWIRDFLKDEFSRDAYLVPNGLDAAFFRPTTPLAPKNGKRLRVLIEGPICISFKGVADAYAAAAPLDCEIWMVSSAGVPEPDWRIDRFFEGVNFEDMPKLYSACDILLKMSRVESFSYPPLEAMACGCSVVVGKVAGSMEYIVHEQNALVVEQRDIEGARAALRRLLEDSQLRARLIEGGFETSRQWDWDRSFKAMRRVVDGDVSHPAN